MSSNTSNLGLTIWNESDPVDFEDINNNFEKIDRLVNCIESGTVTSTYTGGINSTAEWRYKKYSDGSVDMSTVLYFSNLTCNGGTEPPYYSVNSSVNFPFNFSRIYDVQMHLVSNNSGWLSNVTGATINNSISFKLFNITKETEDAYKQIFISIKGVLSN